MLERLSDLNLILLLRSIIPSWLTPLFLLVSFLGEEQVYLLLALISYWIYGRRKATVTVQLLLIGFYIVALLKGFLALERPPFSIRLFEREVESFAFPSGHMFNATVLIGWLLVLFKRRFILTFGSLWIVMTAIARLYLGVHYPRDIVGGFIIGASYVSTAYLLVKPLREDGSRLVDWRACLPSVLSLGFLAASSMLLVTGLRFTDPLRIASFLSAFSVSALFANRYVSPQDHQSLSSRFRRAVIGLSLLGIAVLMSNLADLYGTILLLSISYLSFGFVAGFLSSWLNRTIDIRYGQDRS